MGWDSGVVQTADVPIINLDIAGVANQADILRISSARFGSLAESLVEKWGGLALSYQTFHTAKVLIKMKGTKGAAVRAGRVYDQMAWALEQFVSEMRVCRYEADMLDTAVRRLLSRDDVHGKALEAGTYEFERNLACRREASRIHANITKAQERCTARLDAIGEDPDAFDPYKDMTTVRTAGHMFGRNVDVEGRPLDWELFGNTGSVDGSQVDQGGLGNCWFMSSLAALADKDPEAVRRMVRDNGDGNYTVTLYVSGEWQSIHVDNTMLLGESGRPVFAGNDAHNDQALWPLLVEKAAIRAYGGDYLALNAGTGEVSMEMFTGNPAKTGIVTALKPWDQDDIAYYSSAAREPGTIMTANSNVSPNVDSYPIEVKRSYVNESGKIVELTDQTVDFSDNHVYQVADIAPNGDVTLVDPNNSHGVSEGVDNDRFTITAEQFQKRFCALSVGNTLG